MRKNNSRNIIMVLVTVALILASGIWNLVYAAPEVYKVCHMNPFTGTNAEFGLMFKQSAILGEEELNASGGINGVKLEILHEDNMADPQKAIAAFNKLTMVNKVPMVTCAFSGTVIATASVANSTKALLINVSGNSPLIRDVAGKYVISVFPLADLDITLLTQYVYQKMGLNRGACIYINNESGRLNAKVFKETMEKLGGKIVAFESHEPDAMEFGAQLAKIKAAKPNVLHISSLTQEGPRIVRQARELGINCQLTSYSVVEAKEMLETAAEASDGLIYSSLSQSATIPEVKEYLEKYKKRWGKEPIGSAYSMYMYDLFRTIVPVTISYMAQKSMAYTGESFCNAMMTIRKFETKITGPTEILDDHTVVKPVQIKRINAKEKKFELITTLTK